MTATLGKAKYVQWKLHLDVIKDGKKMEKLEPSFLRGCCLCIGYAHFKPFALILRGTMKLPQRYFETTE